MGKEYLYGASVQGIQSFIFKTNKLVDVIGASEMVELICTELYKEIIEIDDNAIIVAAAGNLKLLLSESECKQIVLEFPKKVMEFAPGITLSQAVVEVQENSNLSDCINIVERRLETQRNLASKPVDVGYMGTQRDRRSGEVAVQYIENKPICQATVQKRAHAKKSSLINKIVGDGNNVRDFVSNQTEDLSIGTNAFIAVIHADGNGLGNLIQEMSRNLTAKNADNGEIQSTFSDFSKSLEEATSRAAQSAFKSLDFTIEEKNINKLPLRPIILGGDDLTILLQADMALPFVEKFLTEFENQTELLIGEKLTACAGIAYVKNKFPLHYAMDLSVKLCKEAKEMTKREQSGMSFFKVQDSYIGDLEEMRERVNLTDDVKYSAYNMEKFNKLRTAIDALNANSDVNKSGVSKLRQWITELTRDSNSAKFMLERIKIVNNKFYESLKTEEVQIIYDAMQIHSLKN